MMMTQEIAQEIARFHNANGGSTWSLETGNLRGQRLYAVGRHGVAVAAYQRAGDRYVFVEGTAKLVYDAWEFLGRPTHLGTWWDEENERAIIERIVIYETLEQAQARSKREGGRYIFDLENGSMIHRCAGRRHARGLEMSR